MENIYANAPTKANGIKPPVPEKMSSSKGLSKPVTHETPVATRASHTQETNENTKNMTNMENMKKAVIYYLNHKEMLVAMLITFLVTLIVCMIILGIVIGCAVIPRINDHGKVYYFCCAKQGVLRL